MRGTVKTRNASILIAAAILLAGAGSTLRAQDAATAGSPAPQAAATAAPISDTVPVTTNSATARQAYEMGMVQREDRLFVDQGLQFFRQAVKADPHFTMGHAALAYFTADPKEEEQERALALQYLANATPDEQLLIRFLNGTKDGELVPAIAAMNDLLARYPRDKRLANLYGEWLCSVQGGFDPGEALLQRLLKSDPHYYPAMNNLAYCYALSGRPGLAPPLMEQYVAALPNEPNPQDSYGEMMRMLQDYPAALDHYRKALRINPNFNPSQVGVASTYALMGDQQKARPQYLVAIRGTTEHSTQMNYRILWAMTYYRENRPRIARQEMLKLAAQARLEGLPLQEAEIYRTMAIFNPDSAGALKDLDASRAVLADTHNLQPGDRDNELASILQTRALIAAGAGNTEAAEDALKLLTSMAESSRSAPVQNAYHSANGAVLAAKGDYAGAIPELQEDAQNPLSLRVLVQAQTKAGQSADAQKTLATLAAISDERAETAFAAPDARTALKSATPQTAQGGAN
jgi:tetratricopeptide (TPR) repeat protein